MKLSNLTSLGRILLFTLLTLGIVLALSAQDEPRKPAAPPPAASVPAAAALKPTEVQSLRLQVRQKDALLAKAALEQAQHAFQQALQDLTAEGERVRVEQGWPAGTQFDPNTLAYSAAPAAKEPKK